MISPSEGRRSETESMQDRYPEGIPGTEIEWLAARIAAGLLAAPTTGLFLLGVAGATIDGGSPAIGAVLLAVAGATVLGLRQELRFLEGTLEWSPPVLGETVRLAGAIVGGTLLTLAAAVELGLSPIVAAGLVGVLAAVFVPKYSVPAYCGAFVGMTSPVLFESYWIAGSAGLLATGVFLFVQPVFHGVGGKLGTTAFVSVLLTVTATEGSFESGVVPESEIAVIVVAVSVAGAVATYGLHTRTAVTPVFASGVVGSVAGLTLPALAATAGWIVPAAAYAASFAGMTDPKRISSLRWVGLAGVGVGLAVVYTMPYLGGSGGKLGTIAFGSVLAVYGLLSVTHVVRLRRRKDVFPPRDTT